MKLPVLHPALYAWIPAHFWRFVKFALVGMSGTLVNLAVLWTGQEHLFSTVADGIVRFNLALALAIFAATVNNFLWNRAWTWGDRKTNIHKVPFLQFLQYFGACSLSICVQFIGTNLLADRIHYLAANGLAICAAALVNFLLNNLWTFSFPCPQNISRKIE